MEPGTRSWADTFWDWMFVLLHSLPGCFRLFRARFFFLFVCFLSFSSSFLSLRSHVTPHSLRLEETFHLNDFIHHVRYRALQSKLGHTLVKWIGFTLDLALQTDSLLFKPISAHPGLYLPLSPQHFQQPLYLILLLQENWPRWAQPMRFVVVW